VVWRGRGPRGGAAAPQAACRNARVTDAARFCSRRSIFGEPAPPDAQAIVGQPGLANIDNVAVYLFMYVAFVTFVGAGMVFLHKGCCSKESRAVASMFVYAYMLLEVAVAAWAGYLAYLYITARTLCSRLEHVWLMGLLPGRLASWLARMRQPIAGRVAVAHPAARARS
jgi:hypothetical protein